MKIEFEDLTPEDVEKFSDLLFDKLTAKGPAITEAPVAETSLGSTEFVTQFGREIHDPRSGKLLGSRRGTGASLPSQEIAELQRIIDEAGTIDPSLVKGTQTQEAPTPFDGPHEKSDLQKIIGDGGFGREEFTVRVDNSWAADDEISFGGSVLDKEGKTIGHFDRMFVRESDGSISAVNEQLHLDAAKRGTGFATEFNRHMEDYSATHGVSQTVLVAQAQGHVQGGSVVWAKAGFDFDPAHPETDDGSGRRSRDLIAAELTKQSGHDPSIVKRLRTSKPPTPYEVVTSPGGEAALAEVSWSGIKKVKPRVVQAGQADASREELLDRVALSWDHQFEEPASCEPFVPEAETSLGSAEFSVLSDTEALNERQTLEPAFRKALAATLKELRGGIDPGLLAETWASAVNDAITDEFNERATEILWDEGARSALDPRTLLPDAIAAVVADHLGGVCGYGELLEGLAYIALSSDQDPITVVEQKLVPERAEHLSDGALVHLRNGLLDLLLSSAGPLTLVAVAKSPFDRTKMWLSMRDDKVRTAHALTDGQTVPTSGVFTTGGSFARYPGDPKLPAALRINCRCRMIPGGADPKVYLANGPRPRIPTGPSTLAVNEAVEASLADSKLAAYVAQEGMEEALKYLVTGKTQDFLDARTTVIGKQRALLLGAVLAAVAFLFKDPGFTPTRKVVADSVGIDPLLTVNQLPELPNPEEVGGFLTGVFLSRFPGVLSAEMLMDDTDPVTTFSVPATVALGREIHDPRSGKLLGSRRGVGTGRAVDVSVGVTQAGTPKVRNPQPALVNPGGRARRKADADIDRTLGHTAGIGTEVEFDHNGGRVRIAKTDDAPGHSQGGEVSLDGTHVGKLWRHERPDPNGMHWQVNPPIREDAPWGSPAWVKTPMDGVDMLVAQQQLYEHERDAALSVQFGREIHDPRTGKLLGSRALAGKISAIKQGFLGTDQMYTNPGWQEGDPLSEKYTPERAALHEQIMADMLANAKTQADPVAVYMGGGPASGKSTTLDSGAVVLPDSHVLVDADYIKTRLPEYDQLGKLGDKKMAGFVHEESSDIAKMLTARSLAMKTNMVVDGTGDSGAGKMIGKIDAARSAGYRVEAVYVSTGIAEAEARNVQRYNNMKADGKVPRMINPVALRETHVQVSRIVPRIADHFDSFRLYSTEGNKPGDPPRLMASATKGQQLTIVSPRDYTSFAKKADAHGPAFGVAFADETVIDDLDADRVDVDVLLAAVLNGAEFTFPEVNRPLWDELVGSVADTRAQYPDAVIEIPEEFPMPEMSAGPTATAQFGREIHDVRSGKLLGSKKGTSSAPQVWDEDSSPTGGDAYDHYQGKEAARLRRMDRRKNRPGATPASEASEVIDALGPTESAMVRVRQGHEVKVTRIGKGHKDQMGQTTDSYKVGTAGKLGTIIVGPQGVTTHRTFSENQTAKIKPSKSTGEAVQNLVDSYIPEPVDTTSPAPIRMGVEDEAEFQTAAALPSLV